MAFRRLPRPLPPAHRGDRYPTRRQAGQHGACLGRSGRTPPVSIGMGGPRCSTITRRPCLFSAVCAAVAPDRPLCFPQMRAHKPCFRRPLVPQNHPPRAPDKHRHSRNTRTCGSQVGQPLGLHEEVLDDERDVGEWEFGFAHGLSLLIGKSCGCVSPSGGAPALALNSRSPWPSGIQRLSKIRS